MPLPIGDLPWSRKSVSDRLMIFEFLDCVERLKTDRRSQKSVRWGDVSSFMVVVVWAGFEVIIGFLILTVKHGTRGG